MQLKQHELNFDFSKKFGPGWNAVVGEAYSFEISYTKWVDFLLMLCEKSNLIYDMI